MMKNSKFVCVYVCACVLRLRSPIHLKKTNFNFMHLIIELDVCKLSYVFHVLRMCKENLNVYGIQGEIMIY